MPDDDSTFDLIQRACRGDRAAFETIVDAYQTRLEDFVRSRIRPELRPRIEIEELVTDTFARAFESLARFDGATEDRFFAWLAGIAKNVVLKEIDRLHRDRALRIERDLSADEASGSSISSPALSEKLVVNRKKSSSRACPDTCWPSRSSPSICW